MGRRYFIIIIGLFSRAKQVNAVYCNVGTPIIALQPGSNGNVLAIGSENGIIRIFDTRHSFNVDLLDICST